MTSYTDGQGFSEQDISASTATIAGVNDAPVLTGDFKATIKEGALYTLTATDIGFTDPDDSAAEVVFTVSGLVNGALLVAGKAAASFTQADLDAGTVKFRHDGSETIAASFQVVVEDGNEDNSVPVGSSFDFTVTPVNDAPHLEVTQTLTTIAEDASTAAARKVAVLTISDADGGDNTLSLAGADAKLFEVRNGALWLKTGAKLDFEKNPDLDVTIHLKDPTLGTNAVDSETLTIAVSDATDTTRGTSGDDTLTGTNGKDIIKGQSGDDILKGRAGADLLIGGSGADTLYGGTGRDVFAFMTTRESGASADKRDTVMDFVHGRDELDLSKIDANADLAGDQAFEWKGKGSFSDKSGELVYQIFDLSGTARDKTIVYGDINHDGKADFQIELHGIVDLTKGDFIL